MTTFSRVQSANSGHVNTATPTATLGSTPTPGNLLVAMTQHRSTETATPTISGSGWTLRTVRFTGMDNNNDRRALVTWSKVAGAEEPTAVTVTWASSVGTRVIVQEFEASDEYSWTYLDGNDAASATGSTGNTAGTLDGNPTPYVWS